MKVCVLLMLVIVACGSGCATQQNKRQTYVDAHPELAADTRAVILDGKITRGMTKEEVAAAWGPPCSYCYGTRQASFGDTWEYNVFGTGVVGFGLGQYVYFDRAGRVIDWSQ